MASGSSVFQKNKPLMLIVVKVSRVLTSWSYSPIAYGHVHMLDWLFLCFLLCLLEIQNPQTQMLRAEVTQNITNFQFQFCILFWKEHHCKAQKLNKILKVSLNRPFVCVYVCNWQDTFTVVNRSFNVTQQTLFPFVQSLYPIRWKSELNNCPSYKYQLS